MLQQPRGNPSKQNAKPSAFRAFVLVVLALALVAYRLLWPWTPFWVDALVIAAAIVIYFYSMATRTAPATSNVPNVDEPR